MDKIVGKRYEYTGMKIGHLTVMTEPRTGVLLNRKGQPRSDKTCLVQCSCGHRYELLLRSIAHSYSPACKLCGKGVGTPHKGKAKSLFEYWMSLWNPSTYKPNTKKLPIFKGTIGNEYIASFCYVDEEDYGEFSRVMCIKPKAYVMYNYSSENCDRLGKKYGGCYSAKYEFIHRLTANVPVGLMGDHINGRTLDNRGTNLRCADSYENSRNTKVVVGELPFIGVGYRKGKGEGKITREIKHYRASLTIKGETYSKNFKDVNEAILYRDLLAVKYQKDFATLNCPEKREWYEDNLSLIDTM